MDSSKFHQIKDKVPSHSQDWNADVADPKAKDIPDICIDDRAKNTRAQVSSHLSDDGPSAMPAAAKPKPSASKYVANIDEDPDSSDDEHSRVAPQHSNRNKKRFFSQLRLRQQMLMASNSDNWRRSTGSLCSSLNQSWLSLGIRSLLDPWLHLDEAAMVWRKEVLENRHMEDDLMEGIRILNNAGGLFMNPLQEKCMDTPPPIKKREGRPLLSKFDSVSSISSTSSTMSIFSSFSLFSNKQRSSRGGMKVGSGRQFLDLTSFHDADDGGVVYEPPPAYDANDDDEMSITSSYSIQVRTPKAEAGGRSKQSRNFLDLTLDPSLHKSSRRGSLLPSTQEDDEQNEDDGSALNVAVRFNDTEDATSGHKSPSHSGDSKDDNMSVDSDQDGVFTSEAWERADAALIESVHDVARLLERNLLIQGHESPFWRFDEVRSDSFLIFLLQFEVKH